MDQLSEEHKEKLQFVFKWLKEKYTASHQAIPSWEITPYTIDLLYHIAKTNIERDGDLEVLRKDYALKTVEYEADGELFLFRLFVRFSPSFL
jgi:hypothetical protein